MNLRRALKRSKLQLFQTALEDKGLELTFASKEERESFRNFLVSFRSNVKSARQKYPEDWAIVGNISILRVEDTKLHLVPRETISHNEKLLLKIVESL